MFLGRFEGRCNFIVLCSERWFFEQPGERPDGNRKNEQALVSSDAGIANSVLPFKLLSDSQKVYGCEANDVASLLRSLA